MPQYTIETVETATVLQVWRVTCARKPSFDEAQTMLDNDDPRVEFLKTRSIDHDGCEHKGCKVTNVTLHRRRRPGGCVMPQYTIVGFYQDDPVGFIRHVKAERPQDASNRDADRLHRPYTIVAVFEGLVVPLLTDTEEA